MKLPNGIEIPALGLGTWQMRGREARDAVQAALELGYRHVDTASLYANEAEVGEAIRRSGVPRDEVFVTTKLWNSDQGYDRAIAACRESLRRLGLSYVDLYLIHWPVPGARLDSWRALVQLEKDGLCRAAGVSNYTVSHLEEVLAASDVVPRVNQIEMSPFLAQREVRAFCAARGIVVEAYSPLTRGQNLRDPVVVSVAKRLGKTPAQVMLRWCLEQGAVVLPKSSRRERIAENAALFDWQLDAEARAQLDRLDRDERFCWDPTGLT